MRKGIGPQGLGAPKSAAKMYGAKSPAKQTKLVKKGKSVAAQQDKGRRVEQGSIVRKADYDLSTESGKDAFKSDQQIARANRRAENNAYYNELSTANNSGGDTKVVRQDRKASELERAQMLRNDATNRTTEADRTGTSQAAVFEVSRKGIKKKKTTAQIMAGSTGREAKRTKLQYSQSSHHLGPSQMLVPPKTPGNTRFGDKRR